MASFVIQVGTGYCCYWARMGAYFSFRLVRGTRLAHGLLMIKIGSALAYALVLTAYDLGEVGVRTRGRGQLGIPHESWGWLLTRAGPNWV